MQELAGVAVVQQHGCCIVEEPEVLCRFAEYAGWSSGKEKVNYLSGSSGIGVGPMDFEVKIQCQRIWDQTDPRNLCVAVFRGGENVKPVTIEGGVREIAACAVALKLFLLLRHRVLWQHLHPERGLPEGGEEAPKLGGRDRVFG